MDQQEYYLNQPRNHECVKLPGKNAKYLLKDNFLNEFFSEDDKAEARSNLGITPLLEELKGLITAKLFDETGNVTFDLEPHEDAYDKVLSSAALYRLFLNYYTKQELDSWKGDLREDFNTFKEEAKIIVDKELDEISTNPVENKAIALKLKEILTAYTTLFNIKANKDDLLNYYTIDEVEDKINEVLDNFEPNNNFTDTLNTTGATNTSDKIYLVGAKTQDENPQTYTQHSAYVGSDGCLYSGGEKVITDISNKIDKVSEAIENNFAVFDENGNLKDSNKNPDDFANVSHTHTISEIEDFPEFSSDINLNLEGLDDRVIQVENILIGLVPGNQENPDNPDNPSTSDNPTNNQEEIIEQNTLVEVTPLGNLRSSGKKTSNFVQTTQNLKTLVIEKADYEALRSYDRDTLYFILEPIEGSVFATPESSRGEIDGFPLILN